MNSLRQSILQTSNPVHRERLQELVDEGEEYIKDSGFCGCAEKSSEDLLRFDPSNGGAIKVPEHNIDMCPLTSLYAALDKEPTLQEVSDLQSSLMESEATETTKTVDADLVAILKELIESFKYARERDTRMSSILDEIRVDLTARLRAIEERLENLAFERQLIRVQKDSTTGVFYGPREQSKRRASAILDLFRSKSVEDLQFLSLQILHKIKDVEVVLNSFVRPDRASATRVMDGINSAENHSTAEMATDEMLQLLMEGVI